MTEIKFRAILKRESTMRDVCAIDFLNLKVLVSISGSPEWHDYKTLVQYTGLEDKNGVEIYEGAIMKFPDGITGKVIYSASAYTAGFVLDTMDGQDRLNDILPTVNEVIGNIYENPELLAVK